MALRYKQYYKIACNLEINKLFKDDIANYILSYIDFDFHFLFAPLQPNRCPCISTHLLYNILIVISDQDINYKSLHIVIDTLSTLTETCSTKPQFYSGGVMDNMYYPKIDMVSNLERIKFNPIHKLLGKRITYPSRNTISGNSNNTGNTISGNTISGNTNNTTISKHTTISKYMKQFKYMHKVCIYSFSLGLIYKLVRENGLVVIANIDIYLQRDIFQIEGYKEQIEKRKKQIEEYKKKEYIKRIQNNL